MKILSFVKKFILIAFIALMPMLAFAEDPTDGGPGDPAIESVPIDDGLPFLIAAGIAMGIYKAYVSNQKAVLLKQKQAIV